MCLYLVICLHVCACFNFQRSQQRTHVCRITYKVRHSLIEAAAHSCGWLAASVSALLTFSPGGPIGPWGPIRPWKAEEKRSVIRKVQWIKFLLHDQQHPVTSLHYFETFHSLLIRFFYYLISHFPLLISKWLHMWINLFTAKCLFSYGLIMPQTPHTFQGNYDIRSFH